MGKITQLTKIHIRHHFSATEKRGHDRSIFQADAPVALLHCSRLVNRVVNIVEALEAHRGNLDRHDHLVSSNQCRVQDYIFAGTGIEDDVINRNVFFFK